MMMMMMIPYCRRSEALVPGDDGEEGRLSIPQTYRHKSRSDFTS